MIQRWILMSGVAVLILCPSAFAQNDDNARHQVADVYQQLNLSAQQQQAIENNRQQYEDQLRGLQEQINQVKQALRAQLQNSDVDEQKVEVLKTQLQDLQTQLTDLRVKSIRGVRDILSPEQYNLFDSMTEQ